ncbi:hypothetical protein MLD38_023617 [Melastoma candidum]|uniref:Uncharacterized protein n=1 Tax=Melastoma candidum TaxID=119954 RepID=A0ACB9NT51_9MYRT|nr:hypothetical protein MLD38_023617 [Melastoma candidum]
MSSIVSPIGDEFPVHGLSGRANPCTSSQSTSAVLSSRQGFPCAYMLMKLQIIELHRLMLQLAIKALIVSCLGGSCGSHMRRFWRLPNVSAFLVEEHM